MYTRSANISASFRDHRPKKYLKYILYRLAQLVISLRANNTGHWRPVSKEKRISIKALKDAGFNIQLSKNVSKDLDHVLEIFLTRNRSKSR